jgi:hypothetical protein
MDYCIETKEIVVLIQGNGIIRNKKGRFLARLDDEIDFDGEHLVEEKMYSREDMISFAKYVAKIGFGLNHTDSLFDRWIKENLEDEI